MEKLLKLMNEWQQSFNPGYEFTYKYSEESAREDLNKLSQLKLFIKRLVDNDKIKKSYKEGLPAITKNGFLLEGETVLLMLLAISDNPIELLISILK